MSEPFCHYMCPSCKRLNDPIEEQCVQCGESFADVPACMFTADNVKQGNPAFDKEKYAQAVEEGRAYDVPRDRSVPVGTVYRGRHAWIHCTTGVLNSPPRAMPMNDACRRKVNSWDAGKEERWRVFIDAKLADPPEDEDAQRWLKKLAIAYGRYNGELDDDGLVPLFDDDDESDEWED